MAAAIRKEKGIESELIGGSGGVFDVKLDGTLLFSKKAEGRFPDNAEILDKLPVAG